MDKTYKTGEKLQPADLEERQMQYLYPEGDGYVFMDTSSYDQISLTKEQLGDNSYYLLDGTMVDVLFSAVTRSISRPLPLQNFALRKPSQASKVTQAATPQSRQL